jgi:hypothetical protein
MYSLVSHSSFKCFSDSIRISKINHQSNRFIKLFPYKFFGLNEIKLFHIVYLKWKLSKIQTNKSKK